MILPLIHKLLLISILLLGTTLAALAGDSGALTPSHKNADLAQQCQVDVAHPARAAVIHDSVNDDDPLDSLWFKHHHRDHHHKHHHHKKCRRCPPKCKKTLTITVTATTTATATTTTTVTGPVTITEVAGGKTYTRTVTDGDSTSLPCPTANLVKPTACPTGGPVTITEIAGGKSYTRTVTDGDSTSLPCPTATSVTPIVSPTCPTTTASPTTTACPTTSACPTTTACPTCPTVSTVTPTVCPTGGPITITEVAGRKTYTRTVTDGDSTSLPCPTAVTITDTINGKIYTRTVTDGATTSLTKLCPDDNCVVTQIINDKITSFTFTGTMTTTIDIPCPTPTTTPSRTFPPSTSPPTPTPTKVPDCLCTDSGEYCGETWPAKCNYGTDTVYNCPGPKMKPVVDQTCKVKRCLQEGKEAHCMVDCELEVHAGIYSGKDYGSIWYFDLENNGTYEKLADSKGTGAVWGIAVNKQEVEMKSSGGVVYRGAPDNYWNLITALNQRLDVHAYGSRKNGQFIYASANNGGAIWIYDDPPNADPLTAKFINLAGNSRTFCSDYFACIQDIAYDGHDYAWVIDGQGHLYISTQKQDSNVGGPMKHIGLISNYPGGNSFGIAFDAFGYVYYAGTGDSYGWVNRAHISTPLDSSAYYRDSLSTYGDLASCAYPKVDISHFLA